MKRLLFTPHKRQGSWLQLSTELKKFLHSFYSFALPQELFRHTSHLQLVRGGRRFLRRQEDSSATMSLQRLIITELSFARAHTFSSLEEHIQRVLLRSLESRSKPTRSGDINCAVNDILLRHSFGGRHMEPTMLHYLNLLLSYKRDSAHILLPEQVGNFHRHCSTRECYWETEMAARTQ